MPARARFKLIWLLWAAASGGCESQQPPPQANSPPSPQSVNLSDATAPPQQSPQPEVISGPDLATIKRFTARVISGDPSADDDEPVEEISDWSFNQRGQLTVLMDKVSDSDFFEWDLHLFDGEQVDCLMSQRAKGPFSDRVVRKFLGCELNDRGAALLHVAQDDPPGWKLVLVDRQKVLSLPLVRPLPEDPFATECVSGSQGHVAFVERKPAGRVKPDLFLTDGTHLEVCASAHNDPFDPRRRFRGFGRLHTVNARGQVLFEASVQEDGRLVADDQSPRGKIRELARQGETLPGTDWTVYRDTACWDVVLLSDGGDVVFASLDFDGSPNATGGVFVLRPGSNKWQELLSADARKQASQSIQSISFPSINAQGQVACVVQLVNQKTGEADVQLVRIEPDAKRTVIARQGDKLGPSLTMDHFSAVQLLADGKVVFKADLRPAEFSGPREAALVVADQQHQRLIIRESELPVTGFHQVQIDDFRTSDALQVAVLVQGDVIEEVLVLMTPEFSVPQVRQE